MTGYPWTAWLWWIGGAALGLLGLWLLYWSLLRDRSKGRRRCPKCWYNMSGTDSMTCSECGRTVKREKKLYKTHRRWRLAAVALLALAICYPILEVPKAQQHGLVSAIPTSLLIAAVPWMPPHSDMPFADYSFWATSNPTFLHELRKELDWRVARDDLAEWQWQWLIWKSARGDSRRKPPMWDWAHHYGRFLNLAYEAKRLGDEPLSREFERLRYYVKIETRDCWPSGVPVRIKFWAGQNWGGSLAGNANARPLFPGGRIASKYHWGDISPHFNTSYFRDGTMAIGIPPIDAERINFEITIDDDPDYRSVVSIPICIKGTIEEYLTAVYAEEVVEAFSTIQTARLDQNLSIIVLPTKPIVFALSTLKQSTLGLDIQIQQGGVTRAIGRAWWPSYDRTWNLGGKVLEFESIAIIPIEWIEDQPTFTGSRWTVKIRGDAAVALGDASSSRYWSGEATVPLHVP